MVRQRRTHRKWTVAAPAGVFAGSLAKYFFALRGVNAAGSVQLRQPKMARGKLGAVVAAMPLRINRIRGSRSISTTFGPTASRTKTAACCSRPNTARRCRAGRSP